MPPHTLPCLTFDLRCSDGGADVKAKFEKAMVGREMYKLTELVAHATQLASTGKNPNLVTIGVLVRGFKAKHDVNNQWCKMFLIGDLNPLNQILVLMYGTLVAKCGSTPLGSVVAFLSPKILKGAQVQMPTLVIRNEGQFFVLGTAKDYKCCSNSRCVRLISMGEGPAMHCSVCRKIHQKHQKKNKPSVHHVAACANPTIVPASTPLIRVTQPQSKSGEISSTVAAQTITMKYVPKTRSAEQVRAFTAARVPAAKAKSKLDTSVILLVEDSDTEDSEYEKHSQFHHCLPEKLAELCGEEQELVKEMYNHKPKWDEPSLKEGDPRRYDEISPRGYVAIRKVAMHFMPKLKKKKGTFIDLGSGAGQVVIHAGLPQSIFSRCIGIEIRDDLFQVAQRWVKSLYKKKPRSESAGASIEFFCDKTEGFLADCFKKHLKDADVLFSYNVKFNVPGRSDGGVNGKLGALLPETMKRGAVFLCAHPVSFDRESGMEKLEIPPDLTPGVHTTRHGMTRLPLYAYRRK